jgi:hypothetical protein
MSRHALIPGAAEPAGSDRYASVIGAMQLTDLLIARLASSDTNAAEYAWDVLRALASGPGNRRDKTALFENIEERLLAVGAERMAGRVHALR